MIESLRKVKFDSIEGQTDQLISNEKETKHRNRGIKPRSHALIYTRYVNYTYMYNLHPGVKIYLLRVHMFQKSFGPNRA